MTRTISILLLLALLAPDVSSAAGPLRVCATVPELASLVRAVGGDAVTVTTFVDGGSDAHFTEPRPSFVKALSEADLLVFVGMDLEAAWLPALVRAARNERVLPGGQGSFDASRGMEPLDVPTGRIDRSRGDVHPYGNPHYLLDPMNGLAVAERLAGHLASLRPDRQRDFSKRLDAFRAKLGTAMVGETLAGRYDLTKLAKLAVHGRLRSFLEDQGQLDQLGGWLARLGGPGEIEAISDHSIWPYFARRFGLRIVGLLEPRPGIPPTTGHLREVIETVRAREVPILLTAAYYDPRHASFVARHTGIEIVEMANQAGARPGTEEYLTMVDWNVSHVAEAVKRE